MSAGIAETERVDGLTWQKDSRDAGLYLEHRRHEHCQNYEHKWFSQACNRGIAARPAASAIAAPTGLFATALQLLL